MPVLLPFAWGYPVPSRGARPNRACRLFDRTVNSLQLSGRLSARVVQLFSQTEPVYFACLKDTCRRERTGNADDLYGFLYLLSRLFIDFMRGIHWVTFLQCHTTDVAAVVKLPRSLGNGTLASQKTK